MNPDSQSYFSEQPPLGVVLAGGSGTRMGGDKPLKRLNGHSLVEIALERLAMVCPRQAVVAWDLDAFIHLPAELLRDRWPGEGPLGAIASALLESGAESILTLPVDLPFVSSGLLRQLAASPQMGLRAAAPMSPKGLEPLVAYFHRSCLVHALRLLQKGERRPRRLLRLVHARRYTWTEVQTWDRDGAGFMNLNTPQDLSLARALQDS